MDFIIIGVGSELPTGVRSVKLATVGERVASMTDPERGQRFIISSCDFCVVRRNNEVVNFRRDALVDFGERGGAAIPRFARLICAVTLEKQK